MTTIYCGDFEYSDTLLTGERIRDFHFGRRVKFPNGTVRSCSPGGSAARSGLAGEVAELRAEVARLRAERQDRGGEDVAEMSRRPIH